MKIDFTKNGEVLNINLEGRLDTTTAPEFENFLKENAIDIAIISVQKELAEEVAKKVISAGIKSIWNFAPTDLYFAGDVVCENINMSESLMRLIYRSKKIED